MRVISSYFQHLNSLKEHNRAFVKDPPRAHGCCWQRVLFELVSPNTPDACWPLQTSALLCLGWSCGLHCSVSSSQGGGGKKGVGATFGRKKDFKCRICPCCPCGCSHGDVEACGERKKQEWQSSARRALLSCSHAGFALASSGLLSCGLDFFMQPANVCSASLGRNSQWYLVQEIKMPTSTLGERDDGL